MHRSLSALVIPAFSLSLLGLAACGGTTPPPKDPDQALIEGDGDDDGDDDTDKPDMSAANDKPKTYDKKLTMETLKRAQRASVGCAKIHKKGPFGSFEIDVVVTKTGRVKSVGFPSELEGKEIATCVEKAYKSEIFPTWDGPDATIKMKLELKGTAAPEKKSK